MKRKFKVPRGTGALVAKEQGLAPSHVTRVIRGKREGGPRLVERLEQLEVAAKVTKATGLKPGDVGYLQARKELT